MTTVPMTRSEAVGVMSDRTRAMLPRVLSARFSSWLYPSDERSSDPSTDEDGGRDSAIDFPSVTKFWPPPPGGCSICTDLKSARQLFRGGADLRQGGSALQASSPAT